MFGHRQITPATLSHGPNGFRTWWVGDFAEHSTAKFMTCHNWTFLMWTMSWRSDFLTSITSILAVNSAWSSTHPSKASQETMLLTALWHLISYKRDKDTDGWMMASHLKMDRVHTHTQTDPISLAWNPKWLCLYVYILVMCNACIICSAPHFLGV